MTEPTTSPSTSLGFTPGTESKHALPASQIRSRYDALRTPNFDTPAPTSATFLMAVLHAVAARASRGHAPGRCRALSRRHRSAPSHRLHGPAATRRARGSPGTHFRAALGVR